MLDWDKAAADAAYRVNVEEAEQRQRLLLEQRAREVCAPKPCFASEELPAGLHVDVEACGSDLHMLAPMTSGGQLLPHARADKVQQWLPVQASHTLKRLLSAHLRQCFGAASILQFPEALHEAHLQAQCRPGRCAWQPPFACAKSVYSRRCPSWCLRAGGSLVGAAGGAAGNAGGHACAARVHQGAGQEAANP